MTISPSTMWGATGTRRHNPAFLEFVGDVRGRQVLDAGCGEGYNTRILARRGARMTDDDLSERTFLTVQQMPATPIRLMTVGPG